MSRTAVFIVGGLLLLSGGCSLTTHFVTEDLLARLPRMTCAELARNGPPADGQVTLTDLKWCGAGFVGQRRDGDLDLYIPGFPAGLGKEPDPPDLAFLLQLWDDDQRKPLLEQTGPVEFNCWASRGRVVDFTRGPGEVEEWAQDRLQKKYPGIKVENMWVLTVGHGNTPTAARALSAWRYGVAELVAGVALLIWGALQTWRRRLGDAATPPHTSPSESA
jgi:hypothetical protein